MGLQAVNNVASTNPVTLADIKAHLRVVDDLTDPSTQATYSSDDVALQTFIDAALDYLQNETRQQFCSLMMVYTIDGFPGWGDYHNRRPIEFDHRGLQSIILPKPPLERVSTVQYLDTNSVLQTMNAGGFTVDTSVKPGRIVLRPGYSWPATDGSAGCVSITFTAGYGRPSDVPTILKQAILLLAGSWYEFRENDIALRLSTIPIGVQAIINQQMFPESVG